MATSTIDTKKQETGINATVTNIKEVKAFINQRLLIYKEKGWKGFNLQESFIDDFKSFIRDILDNLGKDQLKKIRDYLHKNRVYIRKEARKLIADDLLGTIHKPTPSKWPTNNPTNNPTNDPTNGPTNDPTNGPTDNPTNGPTDDPTLALPSLSTAPVQIIQLTPATTPLTLA